MGKADLRDTLKHIIDQTKVYENIEIPKDFEYYPKGIVNSNEVELDKRLIPVNGSIEYCNVLKDWWLEHPKRARTPVWDMVVTAMIDDKPGFILVEAKAHEEELIKESKGKEMPGSNASRESEGNHKRIKIAIEEARDGLNKASQIDRIRIDRDRCYQMSNRLAFAWKLANLGIPVVLIYLGFQNTMEMRNGGKLRLIENYEQWERIVREHSELVGFDLWEIPITVRDENEENVANIYPMIRSLDIQLHNGCLDGKFDINFKHHADA
jgi:hypothetical protein